jgi:ribosomal protein S12 methylthiotransferase
MELQQPIAAKKNQAEIGKIVDVLIEQENPSTGESIGRSARFAPEVDGLVYIQGEASLNSIVSVKVTDADVYDLYAETIIY